jgi:ubiquinone/menaquinone biosynthesis C-methylase UbiE
VKKFIIPLGQTTGKEAGMNFRRVSEHFDLLSDHIRMKAYQAAIHATVRQGDIVADLGTGSGVLAFFAIQAGAQKVYAIERNDIISEAEKLAEKNGMAGKVVFIKGSSDQVNLPEQVDVIISELIGLFGLEENLLHFITDFRQRFLKAGGTLVPAWLDLYLMPVESQELWDATVGLWRKDFYGLDFSPVRTAGFSRTYPMNCAGKVRRMASETHLAHFDFYNLTKMQTSFKMRIPLESRGTMHGYVGYFLAGLAPGIILSTSPDKPPTHWNQIFFPLEEPVEIKEGDILECKITALHFVEIFWNWNTRIITEKLQRVKFSQSDLQISKDDILINRNDYVPALSSKGEILNLVLQACNGERTMVEIAEVLQRAYPERYRDKSNAIRETRSILIGKIK